MNKIVKDLVLLIPLVFLPIYVLNLSSIPYGIHGDEAETALQAIAIKEQGLSLFSLGWYNLPLLSFFPHTLMMIIFGENILGDRMGSIIFGILTLPVFYLLVREMFSSRVALIATVLLASSNIWIALSRLGIGYVQSAFIVVSFIYFFHSGLKFHSKTKLIVAGVFLGLHLYFYFASRILIPLVFLYLVIFFFNTKISKKTLKNLLMASFAALLVFLPLGTVYVANPSTFNSRVNEVFIFSPQTLEWRESAYGKQNNVELIASQIKSSLNIFKGDGSGQYGYKGQLFDYITLSALVLGFIYVIKKRSRESIFAVSWLLLT